MQHQFSYEPSCYFDKTCHNICFWPPVLFIILMYIKYINVLIVFTPFSPLARMYPGSQTDYLTIAPGFTCTPQTTASRCEGHLNETCGDIWNVIMSPPMKWGDILFLAPLSVRPSIRQSVCLCVTLSCPLYIF